MKVHLMAQVTEPWWLIRRAKPTASNFKKIIRASDGNLSKSYRPYLAELLSEAAMSLPNYISTRGVSRGTQAMQDGKDSEGEARAWYAMEKGLDVQMVGFCMADSGCYGCSPDGVIGLRQSREGDTVEGTLELKCCLLRTHFDYLLKGRLPLEFKPQVHGQLVVTVAKWVDFVSYHPDARPLVVRVEPDSYTERVKAAVEEFVGELIHEAKRLGVMLGAEPATAEPAF